MILQFPSVPLNAYMNGRLISMANIVQFLFDQNNDYGLVFFYEQDWDTTTATELLMLQVAYNKKLKDFKVGVVGVSVDSIISHERWLNTEIEQGGIKGVKFPLFSDSAMILSMSAGILNGEFKEGPRFEGNPTARKTVFLLEMKRNEKGPASCRILSQMQYPNRVGINVFDYVRMMESIKELKEGKGGKGVPANWKPGKELLDLTQGDKALAAYVEAEKIKDLLNG